MHELDLARALAAQVASQGGRVYYVGGFVRDRLMGRENQDVDVEVHGIAPQALEAILSGLGTRLELGGSFGIYALAGCHLDIAMPRRETATGSGHRDFRVDVDPWIGPEQAAMRRDFTINAMMEDVLTGEVLDPFGGREDLKAGILRHVNPQAFGEDALRVLRAAQFAARFSFRVAPQTVRLCRRIDLSALPRERILGELSKALLKAEKPSVFFEVLKTMDQLGQWFSEVEALVGVPQSRCYHGEGDVWNHTMLVLDQAALRREQTEHPLWFMLAALTHDFGKAVSTEFFRGDYHAYDHETLGIPLVERFLHRLTGEKALTAYVTNLVRLHMKPNRLEPSSSVKASNRLFDAAACPGDLIHLAACDDLGRITSESQQSREPFLWRRLERYREMMSRPYVMGADLIEQGLLPGPEFRRLLDYAHKLRLAGVAKEEALRQTLGMARSWSGQS